MRRTNSLLFVTIALGTALGVPAAASATPAEGQLVSVVDSVERGLVAAVAAGGTRGGGRGHASLNADERAMIAIVNAERARAGASPVASGSRLTKAADYHTREMIRGDYFAHHSLNGWTFAQRLRRLAGARTAGEVIAYSEDRNVSAHAIVDDWMASAAHRDQLLNRTYNRIGVSRREGRFKRSTAVVYTVDLARVR